RLRYRSSIYLGQGPRVQLQLRLVKTRFVRQVVRLDCVGLKINQPNLLWQNHRQIYHSLDDHKFIVKFRRDWSFNQVRNFACAQSRGETQFALEGIFLSANSFAKVATPECRQSVEIEQRSLLGCESVLRQKSFSFSPELSRAADALKGNEL